MEYFYVSYLARNPRPILAMRLALPKVLSFVLLATGCQNTQSRQSAQTATPSRPVPDASLREIRWVARQLAGKSIGLPASTNEPFLLLRADGTAEGNGSCNRFRGKFFTDVPGELKFGPLMSTRMACPSLNIETDFNIALAQTTNYRITGDTLRLLDATDDTLVRLEAVYLR